MGGLLRGAQKPASDTEGNRSQLLYYPESYRGRAARAGRQPGLTLQSQIGIFLCIKCATISYHCKCNVALNTMLLPYRDAIPCVR